MRKKLAVCLLLATTFIAPAALAYDGLSLDHVVVDAQQITNDSLECGVPVEFYIRVTNDVGGAIDWSVQGSANGFRVYSDDGATWTPGLFVDTSIVPFPPPGTTTYDTTYYGAFVPPQAAGLVWINPGAGEFAIYDGGIFVTTYTSDGVGADTVGFAGYTQTSGVGIYEGFDEIAFEIAIASIDCGSAGKTLCLDSSYYPPSGRWLWSGSPPDEYLPAWDGTHCYTVYNPAGGVGEFVLSGLGSGDSLYFPAPNGTYEDRTFDLTSDGDPITYSIAVKNSSPWLSATPSSGTTDQTITVHVDKTQSNGNAADTLVITGNALKSAPVEVPVYFDFASDVAEGTGNLPTEYSLSQNYPNPFNPTTTIKFSLPEATNVSLDIYNVLGQKVRTLVDGPRAADYYEIVWDGTNSAGSEVASGIYFYKLQTDSYVSTKKMVLSR